MLCSGTPDRDVADIRRVMAWCGLFIMGGVLKLKCQNLPFSLKCSSIIFLPLLIIVWYRQIKTLERR